MATRAERRQQEREEKKKLQRTNRLLQDAGLPKLEFPTAPARRSGLSAAEVSGMTGINMGILNQWQQEEREKIKKECIREAQERLDRASNYMTVCNIMTSLTALGGFRYGKAAALHLLAHYSENLVNASRENFLRSYRELNEKWGVEFEFDDIDLNKEMGFDVVDWRYGYIAKNVPETVYDRIFTDSKNIQSVLTQVAVIWELCDEFRFHKHMNSDSSKLKKFMEGTKKKYDLLDGMKKGATYGMSLLKDKYDIEIGFSDSMLQTIERFKL